MVWLPDGEKIWKISLFVLTQLTNVTDTHTHTAWRHRPRLCIAGKIAFFATACSTRPSSPFNDRRCRWPGRLSTVNSPCIANHVAALSRSCFLYMRQLRSVRHSLTSEAMLTLIQAFVSSRLDYCNTVLAGVSSQLLQKMQVIQNAAAQFIMGTRRRDEMVLHELRWLPQRQRIKFKTAVMVYKCIHDLAPLYLASHCEPTSSCPCRSHLRSTTSGQLNFSRTKTDYGKRSFAVNEPVVWNSLPTELRSPDISPDVFEAKLKTLTADLAHLVYLF